MKIATLESYKVLIVNNFNPQLIRKIVKNNWIIFYYNPILYLGSL